MVLTVSFVLSPVTMLVCHRRLRFTRQLDASVGASGPHDFAVRIKRCSSLSASASTASRPALMTLRNAPLWDRTVSDILLIWGKREVEYFCNRGWTGFSDLPVRQSRGSPEAVGARGHQEFVTHRGMTRYFVRPRASPSRTRRLHFSAKFEQGHGACGIIAASRFFSANKQAREDTDAQILLQRSAEPQQGRAVSGRVRFALRAGAGRYPQGRSVQAGISRRQPERQGAGDRR